MVFEIQDLERDVRKFQQDIENAKVKYLDEYTEYADLTTDLENIGQKYDFLQKEVEVVARLFPEERNDKTLSKVKIGFLSSAIAVEVVSGITYAVAKNNLWKIANNPQRAEVKAILAAIRTFAGRPGEVRIRSSMARDAVQQTIAVKSKVAEKAIRIAKFTAGVGAILRVVSVALTIRDVRQRTKYLEEQKAELQQNLDSINSYINEANEDTKEIVIAFLAYFAEFAIDVDEIFNQDRDGFLNESGKRKFDSAVAQLRRILNRAVKRMRELNTSTKLGNRRIERYISQGLEGEELIEEVFLDTELPEELIQRLYVFRLFKIDRTIEQAIELSQLPADLVRELYARGYLDNGKTVEETVVLSGLSADRVRRVYASKLLDDRLNAKTSDYTLNLNAIAARTGLAKEIILEIQISKIAADLRLDFEKQQDPQLLAR
ncbi:MAG: hypothetical protein AAGE96_09520 [Cyanobacteria bacterium P01_G01_bin.19]